MTKPIKNPLEFCNLILSLLTLLGGVLGYFLVQQHFAEESKVKKLLELSQYIDALQPAAGIDFIDSIYENKSLTVRYRFRNIGRQTIVISPSELKVSFLDAHGNYKELIPNKDYVADTSLLGFFPPGGEMTANFEILFKKTPQSKYIVVTQVFECRLHAALARLTKEYVADYLSPDEIHQLSERTFTQKISHRL